MDMHASKRGIERNTVKKKRGKGGRQREVNLRSSTNSVTRSRVVITPDSLLRFHGPSTIAAARCIRFFLVFFVPHGVPELASGLPEDPNSTQSRSLVSTSIGLGWINQAASFVEISILFFVRLLFFYHRPHHIHVSLYSLS